MDKKYCNKKTATKSGGGGGNKDTQEDSVNRYHEMIRYDYTGFVERREDFLWLWSHAIALAMAALGAGAGAAGRVTWRPSAAT